MKSEVKPSDIAIIVQTNKEARAMKKPCRMSNIPAITDENQGKESDEATDLRYLMEAVYPAKPRSNQQGLC